MVSAATLIMVQPFFEPKCGQMDSLLAASSFATNKVVTAYSSNAAANAVNHVRQLSAGGDD